MYAIDYLNDKLPVYLRKGYIIREAGQLSLYEYPHTGSTGVYYFYTPASMFPGPIAISDDNGRRLFASRKAAVKHAAAAGISVSNCGYSDQYCYTR